METKNLKMRRKRIPGSRREKTMDAERVLEKCKVEFNQPFYWLYSVSNLLVFQHLVTLYLGGFDVRVVSEIEC